MVRRPPRSERTHTRCPYTTPFRSLRDRPAVAFFRSGHAVLPQARNDTSRRPSASRLKPSTSEEIAMQGKIAMCGNIMAYARVSETMPPQSGSGGGRPRPRKPRVPMVMRSEEHTSELKSLIRITYAVLCLKKKKQAEFKQHT